MNVYVYVYYEQHTHNFKLYVANVRDTWQAHKILILKSRLGVIRIGK